MKTNVSIRILENEFPLVCDISEKPTLTKSAEILNKHLREFRRNNPSIDSEQLIIMGALRATCEIVNQLETLSDQAKIANTEIQKAMDLLKD